jgi:DNA-binding HxlR family transcriptional regulator
VNCQIGASAPVWTIEPQKPVWENKVIAAEKSDQYQAELFTLVGRKWALRVLLQLKGRVVRFNALLAEIDGMSAKSLATILKQFEANDLVSRHVFVVIPPRVEYELTPFGEEVIETMLPLALNRR